MPDHDPSLVTSRPTHKREGTSGYSKKRPCGHWPYGLVAFGLRAESYRNRRCRELEPPKLLLLLLLIDKHTKKGAQR